MNTANPQLEGLYLALAAVFDLMVRKGVFTHEELRIALARTEETALHGGELPTDSDSNRKAMAFPIRLLILASVAHEQGEAPDFRALARDVGRSA